jgi:hypothetical protein
MRNDPALTRMPVILTANPPESEPWPGTVSSPIEQILVKPFFLESLLDNIRSAIIGGSRSAVDECVGDYCTEESDQDGKQVISDSAIHALHPCRTHVIADADLQLNDDVNPNGEEDQRLNTQITRGFLATGHRILREVTVTVHSQRVTLCGSVDSYYLKQLAQTTVLNVSGVRGLQNDLAVLRPR